MNRVATAAPPSGKLASRRQGEIIGLLREKGRVSVEDLAAHFDVTPQTIRRDLTDLSDAKMVVRVHGGAMVSSGIVNLAYEARKMIAGPHKKLIGEAAARLVPDHSSVFITIGTATGGCWSSPTTSTSRPNCSATAASRCSCSAAPCGRATAASWEPPRSARLASSGSTSP